MWSPTDEQEWSDGSGGEDHPVARTVKDPEEWQDWTSEFTVAAYHRLQSFFERLGAPVLDKCTYHDFATFCFRHSSGHLPDLELAPFPDWPGPATRPM